MAWTLVVCHQGQIASHPIPVEGSIVIGRGRDCGIQIDHRTIARQHAAIHAGSAGSPPQIEDLGSQAGTRARGAKLASGQRVPLAAGAAIELGGVAAFLQRASPALDRGIQAARTATAPLAGRAIAVDASTQLLYQLLPVVAPTRLTVLLLGEPGAGKGVYAEALHAASSRKAAPLVRLHCAAHTDAALEAELFGCQRGAVPGATQTRPGVFEAGDGGTVFLDEIAELPIALQTRLVRVLETGEVVRMGSTTPRRVDVRVIAATSRALDDEITAGAFRRDLRDRLDEFTVAFPPLRDRPGDLVALATHFAAQPADGAAGCTLTEEALGVWRRHPWRGNVRELRNVVARAAVLCRSSGCVIDAEHARAALSGAMNLASTAVAAAAAASSASATGDVAQAASLASRRRNQARTALRAVEKDQIESALERCGGNQTRAATMLGLGRRTLAIKLDVLGIARPRRKTIRVK
jgi:DNA-binding NtrC family response regulator